MAKGTLFLIPNFIGEENVAQSFPSENIKVIHQLDFFFVERAKSARSFLSKVDHPKPINEIELKELPSPKTKNAFDFNWLSKLIEGKSAGLLSEAGMPAVADPGEKLIALAHELELQVKPLIGPSSILLALAASGLNGEGFSFHGYLPIDKKERTRKIKFFENLVRTQNLTQIFMETPYRNNQLLDNLIKSCSPVTKLCIAANLNSAKEKVITRTIGEWKARKPDLNKQPAIFLIG